jgi:arylsulfatase A-like enzyme
MRPNVLLVVLDTARADGFEPYGAPHGASPAVADLGAAGAVHDAMYAAASWTVPSHVSMFSGLLPRAAGVSQIAGLDAFPRFKAVLEGLEGRLLPAVLRDAGYATRAVSTNLWLSPGTGFSTGFDRFELVSTRRQTQLAGKRLRQRARWSLEGVRARADDGAAEAERIISGWIAEPQEQPFFWFVNLVECHSPYLPPKPYNDLGPLDRLRAAEDARSYLSLDAIWRACAGGFDVPPDALARMRHLYGRAIRLLDDWVGRLAERLDTARLLDETLLIVTSDHGENLGEGGLMGHAFSVDERLIRIPFVSTGPAPIQAGSLASLAGLPRMVADAVGLESHPWTNGLPDDGAVVAQLDPPAGEDDPRVQEALALWGMPAENAPRIGTPLTCAVDGRWKLLLRGDREEAFDLEADPLEASPLPADACPTGVLEKLRAALQHPATLASGPLGGAASAPEAEIPDSERRELEKSMRLLGYM